MLITLIFLFVVLGGALRGVKIVPQEEVSIEGSSTHQKQSYKPLTSFIIEGPYILRDLREHHLL